MVKFLRLGKKQIGGISMLKKVAILANGGDVSGFNAVIRAIIKTAEHNNVECYGFIDGYNGLLKNNYVRLSTANDQSASGILPKGGSILGSSTNANVFNYKVVGENGEVEYKDLSDVCVEYNKKDGFHCIMPIENLRIMILKGRSIWQKLEEKQLWKSVRRLLNTVLSITVTIKVLQANMTYRTAKSILG